MGGHDARIASQSVGPVPHATATVARKFIHPRRAACRSLAAEGSARCKDKHVQDQGRSTSQTRSKALTRGHCRRPGHLQGCGGQVRQPVSRPPAWSGPRCSCSPRRRWSATWWADAAIARANMCRPTSGACTAPEVGSCQWTSSFPSGSIGNSLDRAPAHGQCSGRHGLSARVGKAGRGHSPLQRRLGLWAGS